MTIKTDHRAPQAFKLDPEPTKSKAKPTKIEFATEEAEQELATIPVPPEQRVSRRPRWGFILISALATLFALWLGLSVEQIVESFFLKSAFMGYVALTVAASLAFQHLPLFSAKF